MPPNCGETCARSIDGKYLALGRRERMSDVKCFIGERAWRNGSRRKSNEGGSMNAPHAAGTMLLCRRGRLGVLGVALDTIVGEASL